MVAQWIRCWAQDPKVESSNTGWHAFIICVLGKKQLTITVPLSTQVNKWGPANCWGQPCKMLQNPFPGGRNALQKLAQMQ